MISLSIYKIGVPIGLLAYYLYRLFRLYILKSNMELKFPTLYGLFLGLGIPVSLFLIVQTFFISDLVDYLSLNPQKAILMQRFFGIIYIS